MTMGMQRAPGALEIARGLRKRSAREIVFDLCEQLEAAGLPWPGIDALVGPLDLCASTISRHRAEWERER